MSTTRIGQSLVMDFSILDDAVLPVLDKAARSGSTARIARSIWSRTG